MTSSPATDCPAESGAWCRRRHWGVYGTLIALAISQMTIGILAVRNPATRGESPFFSANDRSRWCTVYSLVHYGTYEIDRVVEERRPIHWDTIDKVRHVGADGRFHQYSSKPPLFSTLLAGQYWLVLQITGWSLDDHPLVVARIMLLLTNVVPFALMLWLLANLLERLFVADWVRYFIVAAAGAGTFLSSFAISINNHLPAAVTAMATLYLVDTIVRLGRREWRYFWVAGLCAAATAANELPAAALVAIIGAGLLRYSWLKTLIAYGGGVAVVLLAYLATNVIAHGLWEIPYKHRSDGPVIAQMAGDYRDELTAGRLPLALRELADDWSRRNGQPLLQDPQVTPGTWMGQTPEQGERWVVRDLASTAQFAILLRSGFGSQADEQRWELREWHNWYDFPGSYGTVPIEKRSMVDRGEPQRSVYAFHMILGHHGIISLTPLWILAWPGLLVLASDFRFQCRWLGWTGIGLTVLVIGFYISLETHDRNYGGQTSALRWAFWLIPFWLLGLAPVVQWLGRWRMGRWMCWSLLAASVLSAGYSRHNPWIHPWLAPLFETWLPNL